MTSTIVLIERLKHRAKFDTCESPYTLMVEAAAELTTLLERCEQAEQERDELRQMFTHADTTEDFWQGKARDLANECDGLRASAISATNTWKPRAETAEAQVKLLREALEPFGNVDNPEHAFLADEFPVVVKHALLTDVTLNIGHFRRARALKEGE